MKHARRLTALLLAVLLLLSLLAGCSSESLDLPDLPVGPVKAAPADYTPAEDGFRYAKTFLSPQEQALYDQLLEGLQNQEEKIDGLYPDADLIQSAIQAIDRDYPELFWFSGTGRIETTLFGEKPIKAVYQPTYTMDQDQRFAAQQKVDHWATECMRTLPDAPSDYDKVYTVYTYLVDHADYQVVDSNSIVNIMVDGRGLCGCYAKTMQYMLNLLGVDCAYISGQAGGEAHAWNLVWLDGTPCWVDVTWGDPVPQDGQENQGPAYEYLGITTADLLRTHTIDNAVPVPDCTSEAYNYFRRNGLYFESFSMDSLTAALKTTISSGADTFRVRFSDSAYQTACNALLNGGQIHTLFQRAQAELGTDLHLGSTLWYTRNDEMSTITVPLP